jgi:hypothetical protein
MNSQPTANAQDHAPGKGSDDLNVRALLVSPYVDDLLPIRAHSGKAWFPMAAAL